MKKGLHSFRGKQSGAILVVALVILAAISLVGISSMQSTTLEMKMVTSSISRSESFARAEAGILRAAAWLDSEVNSLVALQNGTGLFSEDCTDGLCFYGNYESSMTSTYECELTGDSSPWEPDHALNVWNDADLHAVASIDNVDVKYIIEFLCFVGRDPMLPFGPLPGQSSESDPLFRITAHIDSNTGEAPVMIQVSQTVRI